MSAVGSLSGTLSNGISCFLSLVGGLLLPSCGTDAQLIQNPLGAVGELSPKRALGSGGAVLEVVALVACPGDEFVLSRALRNLEAVAVEVVLEFRVGPGVEDGILGGIGLLGEVRCYGRVAGAAGCGGSGVGFLSSGDELLTC